MSALSSHRRLGSSSKSPEAVGRRRQIRIKNLVSGFSLGEDCRYMAQARERVRIARPSRDGAPSPRELVLPPYPHQSITDAKESRRLRGSNAGAVVRS
jgi:hypothetical protein